MLASAMLALGLDAFAVGPGAAGAAPPATAARSTSPTARARPAPPAARPARIVLVTLDGARAGIEDWSDVMPALAALARHGARLRFATTPSPITFPATVAALTGREPATTGIRDEAASAYPLETPGLAATLAAAGYAGLALPGDRTAHARSPLSAGFETFENLAPSFADSVRVDSALSHLGRPGLRFVWIGFSFGQPFEPWRRLRGGGFGDSASYAARAAALDRALARLIAGVKDSARPTLLVVAGTHGEAVPGWPLRGGMGEPAAPGHGADLSEDALRVPLVLWGPGVPAARVPAGEPWVSTVDVAPTLAAAAGVRMKADGVSLWPLVRGGVLAPRVLVHETDSRRLLGAPTLIAAREGRSKRLACGRERIEHVTPNGQPSPPGLPATARLEQVLRARLAARPAAARDTAEILYPDGVAPCDAGAQAWRELLAALPAHGELPDSQDVARLRALRHRWPDMPLIALEETVTRSMTGQDDEAARAFLDLRGRYPQLEEVVIAYADHLRRHRHADLVANVLATLPNTSPLLSDAWWRLAITRVQRFEVDPALDAYREAMALGSPPDPSWVGTYPAFLRIVALRAAAEAKPDSAGRRIEYARALGEFGLYDECYSQLHKARFLDPADPTPNYWMGIFLMAQRRPQDALNALARAIEQDRNHLPSLLASAEALANLGRNAEALGYQRKAVELGGRNPQARYNLACLLARTGDADAAVRELERAVDAGYHDWEQMATDPDLASVRSSETYRRLSARGTGAR